MFGLNDRRYRETDTRTTHPPPHWDLGQTVFGYKLGATCIASTLFDGPSSVWLFIFSKMSIKLKRNLFHTIDEIKEKFQEVLQAVTSAYFKECFQPGIMATLYSCKLMTLKETNNFFNGTFAINYLSVTICTTRITRKTVAIVPKVLLWDLSST